jgi:tetratricopeptide (TPR) repeat protein
MVEGVAGDTDAARQLLQQFFDHHPENLLVAFLLVRTEEIQGDYTAALKTLQAAIAQNPDDLSTRVQLSEVLFQLGRKEEAAAAAKSALDGTDDPGVLNGAAYTLSETGLDLDIAEAAVRKSIAQQEEKSATLTTAQANLNAFTQADLLIASWDTLGWVLFREGKPDEALPLISAAWRDSLNADVGDHLAQIDEALGKKDEAAHTYALAQGTLTTTTLRDVRNHILDSINRLKAAGAKTEHVNAVQELQDLRTYNISRPKDVGGWGAFRLEITTEGVIESQQMSGEQRLAGIKPAIDQMKFPGLVPPGSKAHLLRSAVVSCSMGDTCEVVLVPDGGLQTEQQ